MRHELLETLQSVHQSLRSIIATTMALTGVGRRERERIRLTDEISSTRRSRSRSKNDSVGTAVSKAVEGRERDMTAQREAARWDPVAEYHPEEKKSSFKVDLSLHASKWRSSRELGLLGDQIITMPHRLESELMTSSEVQVVLDFY